MNTGGPAAWQAMRLLYYSMGPILIGLFALCAKLGRYSAVSMIAVVVASSVLAILVSSSFRRYVRNITVQWDDAGLTISRNGRITIFPWAAVGRIDFYSSRGETNYGIYAVRVTQSLLIELYEDGKMTDYRFYPNDLDLGGRPLSDVIADMNALHERALLNS